MELTDRGWRQTSVTQIPATFQQRRAKQDHSIVGRWMSGGPTWKADDPERFPEAETEKSLKA